MINFKKILAKKMKPRSLKEFEEEAFRNEKVSKFSGEHSLPKNMGINHKGSYDPSNEAGHGMRKGQGLTNYIDYMLKAEKEGKFKFDTHK